MVARIRLSRLEFLVMETLWKKGRASIREMLEGLPGKKRPTYSTVQTMVYRLEAKGALNRIRLSGNFHLFDRRLRGRPLRNPSSTKLLAILGGEARPIVARLIAAGKLTMEDVEFAEKTLKELKKGDKAK